MKERETRRYLEYLGAAEYPPEKMGTGLVSRKAAIKAAIVLMTLCLTGFVSGLVHYSATQARPTSREDSVSARSPSIPTPPSTGTCNVDVDFTSWLVTTGVQIESCLSDAKYAADNRQWRSLESICEGAETLIGGTLIAECQSFRLSEKLEPVRSNYLAFLNDLSSAFSHLRRGAVYMQSDSDSQAADHFREAAGYVGQANQHLAGIAGQVSSSSTSPGELLLKVIEIALLDHPLSIVRFWLPAFNVALRGMLVVSAG